MELPTINHFMPLGEWLQVFGEHIAGVQQQLTDGVAERIYAGVWEHHHMGA